MPTSGLPSNRPANHATTSSPGRPSTIVLAWWLGLGFLFEFITCPNYTAEILGWLFFNIGTQTLMGYAFMLSGAFQMYLWAVQKHKRLRRQFDGKDGRPKYPRRWIIMPPFA